MFQKDTKLFFVVRDSASFVSTSVSSVTRWLECLFNIWPFKTMKICQIKLKIMPKYKMSA